MMVSSFWIVRTVHEITHHHIEFLSLFGLRHGTPSQHLRSDSMMLETCWVPVTELPDPYSLALHCGTYSLDFRDRNIREIDIVIKSVFFRPCLHEAAENIREIFLYGGKIGIR